ncbi:hypothetical protein B7494_g4035 [Chlorociboria aeruginascens]|nr:hypothetical protein B7494_g4035 [Chlorociboria aeruginascens]
MHCKALLVVAASLISSSLAFFLEETVIARREAVPAPISFPVGRRDSNEGVYLVNCETNAFGWSEMAYYSNAKQESQNGQTPDTTSIVDSSSFIAWEGQEVCGFFQSSGETFCSDINSDAQSQATGAVVGSGGNDQTGFNCFKDDNRELYGTDEFVCFSIYYCYDS